MLLGEFRKKTEKLDDNVELIIFIEEKEIDGQIVRDEVIAPVNTLDLDPDTDSGCILSLTDAQAGSYSL